MRLQIFPPDCMPQVCINLPLSKSISARTLVIDALAGVPTAVAVAKCDDTDALAAALGVRRGTVSANLAGTALRFLTAYYAAVPGTEIVLTGNAPLLRRPVAPLVDALRALGADIEYDGNPGHAPLRIRGKRLTGGTVTVDGGISSQFISALMMVAPYMDAPLNIKLTGDVVSTSYLRMTAAMMSRRGAVVDIDPRTNVITVGNTPYDGQAFETGADWSAASYWYAFAALSAGWVTLPGLRLPSLQGDSALAALALRLGVETNPYEPDGDDGFVLPDGTAALQLSVTPETYSRFDADMTDTPDLVPALAVTAALLGMPFRLTGVRTLRNKETDRIAAVIAELDKIGIVAFAEGDDVLQWDGERHPITRQPVFRTYDDHRMAMAFAMTAQYLPGIVVDDAGVVSKSYPGFWDDMRAAGFELVDLDASPAADGDAATEASGPQ